MRQVVRLDARWGRSIRGLDANPSTALRPQEVAEDLHPGLPLERQGRRIEIERVRCVHDLRIWTIEMRRRADESTDLVRSPGHAPLAEQQVLQGVAHQVEARELIVVAEPPIAQAELH